MMKIYLFFLVLCLSLSSTNGLAKDSLILAVHPYLSYDEILKKFSPMAKYLSQKTGKNIQIRVGSDYQEHIDYIGKNKVDIAYMGPASYVRMVNLYGEKPVLARLEIKGENYFQGNIIVSKHSSIKTLDDLKGKRIAYGDPNSTMSYIVPHYMLHQAGVYTKAPSNELISNEPISNEPEKHDFLHSHSNVAIAVLSGDFDAGAVKPAIFKKFKSQGLRTLVVTPKISEHLFVTRSSFSQDDFDMLRRLMLDMKNTEQGLHALHAIKGSITGLVETSSKDYDNLREIIAVSDKLH